jgi:NADPH:quinone reductase-like Zn-dependent oxidoreductase
MYEDARAFWITSPGHGEIRRETVPAPAEGDVVIRTMYTAISRGTEALVFQGRVPVSEYGRMRAPFQAGDFPGPLKYGYANVGCVEHGPPDLVNQHVFVLFPHQKRYTVPSDSVFVLPEGVPPHRAVLAANLETAINGLWDARPQIGDRVAVVGGGTVGCLVAWLAGRIPGCEVELVDINPQRAVIAQALGVRFARPEAASDGADLVIHASGSPAGLQLALSLAAFEATIAELSWYGDQPVTVALGQAFHARRLTLKSSQVGTVAPSQRARWNPRRRMQLALAALTEPALDVLITGENEFDQLPQVMADLSRQPGNTLCHRIRYGQYIG